ncbi:ABC transporter permease subunit [Ruegeria sp.]|uniref:branched-chain amino acid ABC transporter ATP-binding protein/permease n=1 Tax=Ruegeria sp. TaxID=1879320 RepID=UPI003B59C9A2
MVWLRANALFAGAALLVLPYVIDSFLAYTLALYMLYAVACLGVGLSWGQAGLLSLGQGLFVGLGGYLSGLSLIALDQSWFVYLLLLLCALIPGALGVGIGLLIFRVRTLNGAFFALITLGLVLLASLIATSWNSVTGGFNGLLGVPGLPGLSGFEYAYPIAATALFFAILLVAWLMATPLGVLWRAVALDERRLSYLGFDPNLLKTAALGISGFLGGVAGVLYAPINNLVTPDLFGFALSTNFVIWVAIGGRMTLYGPVLGAIGIGLLTATLRDRIDYWEVVLAVIFMATVLYFKWGLLGHFEPRIKSWLDHRRASPSPAPARAPTYNGTLRFDLIALQAGQVQILNDLSFSIDAPGIYCIIGPNGAGKTTTFNALTGELPVQAGEMRALDSDSATPDAKALVGRGLARKFQIPSVFDTLSIGENLSLALWAARLDRRDAFGFAALNWTSPMLQALEQRFAFLKERDRAVRDLSHGQRQMLDLAMVLCSEPTLILLDEPCAGLSKAETHEVTETIRWACKELGATGVIIEHDMALVQALADRVFVLHSGTLLAEGSVSEIQENADVKAVYEGRSK